MNNRLVACAIFGLISAQSYAVDGSCGDDATLISAVQGSGEESPLAGDTVTIEGVVTGNFENMSAFFVQEEAEDSDEDSATSEGIFIYYTSSGDMPAVGTQIRLTGEVSEYYDKTEITLSDDYATCGTGTIEAVEISLPFASELEAEALEGMLVTFTEALTVTDVYSLNQYGEVTLSNGRLWQSTQLYAPGSDEQQALAESNSLNQITLDDASTETYPEDIVYPTGGLSADNTLRAGDQVSSLTGVVDYSYSEYRIYPTVSPVFSQINTRDAAPTLTTGEVTIASMNVLNLFNGDGDETGFPTSRGADNYEEYERQLAKIVQAITTMSADIVGLMELENDGFGDNSAIAQLVEALNSEAGDGTYAYVDGGDEIGTDDITNGLIYNTNEVELVGDVLINDDSTFNRPPVAQRFALLEDNTKRITVIVNHLKSKGCTSADGDDEDQGDGQSCYNATRVAQVEMLLDWISSDSTLSNQDNVLVIGDMNAYAKEDPIQTFSDNGYTDMISEIMSEESYSYSYYGEFGTLDYAIANATLAEGVTGATLWAINADEPNGLNYNTENKTDEQLESLYSADAYRSSDHDPVIVSFNLVASDVDDSDDDNSDDDSSDDSDSEEKSSSGGGAAGVNELAALLFVWMFVSLKRRKRQ